MTRAISTSDIIGKMNKKILPPINLQRYIALSNDNSSFRLFFGSQPFNYSGIDYRDAISRLFDNKLSLVESSLRKLSNNGREDILTGIVTANQTIEPFTDKSVEEKGLVCLSSAQATNIFMDNESAIWKLVDNGDTKILVQTSEENYEDIIKARTSRSLVVSNVTENVVIDYINGDYGVYFNPTTQAVSYGFIYKTVEPASGYAVNVFDRLLGKEVSVSEYHVIEAAALDDKNPFADNPSLMTTATVTKDSARKYLDYMRNLYRDTNFFNALEKQLKIRLAIGPSGL